MKLLNLPSEDMQGVLKIYILTLGKRDSLHAGGVGKDRFHYVGVFQ